MVCTARVECWEVLECETDELIRCIANLSGEVVIAIRMSKLNHIEGIFHRVDVSCCFGAAIHAFSVNLVFSAKQCRVKQR